MKIAVFVLSLSIALLAVSQGEAAPPTDVAAAPMKFGGINPAWPRLTKFPDKKVMARVNALLAAKEKDIRQEKTECFKTLNEMRLKPDDRFYVATAVTYLSRRFLSVMQNTSSDCGGPYPTNGALDPLTIDLSTGAALDWKTVFKPGFLPASDGKQSTLTQLYRDYYKKIRSTPDDKECRDAVMEQDPFESTPIIYLDAKRGVVFQPDFPHVIAACADDMALPAIPLGFYMKNRTLFEDLKAVVKGMR